MPGHVLVTVGSTKFDQLISAVDTEAFAAALHEQGYTSLLVQVSTPQCLYCAHCACTNVT